MTRRRPQQVASAVTQVIMALLLLAAVLFYVEGSFGHDGLLCELGWDSDGAGLGTTGCG